MAHIHEKIDFTVEVFIVFMDKVLLRFHDKYKIWLSVGGHIELDEDPNQAAHREVKEEVGLTIKLIGQIAPVIPGTSNHQELIVPMFMNRHRISPSHEHTTLTYFATTESDRVQVDKTAGDASNDWKWVTLAELNDMDLKPDVRFYAEAALKALAK